MTSFSTSGLLLFRLNRLPHAVLMAGGLALTFVLGSTPAQAADQYCTRSSPGTCRLDPGFNGDTDTYFWSPTTAVVAIDLKAAPFTNKVKKLTLRSSNTVPLNAIGNPNQAEVLIGSLGINVLQGNGAPAGFADTYVVGKSPSSVTCRSSGVTCIITGNQGNESDSVVLPPSGTNVIYIDRCLQMSAPLPNGQPGKGGLLIRTANMTTGSVPFASITDTAASGACSPLASIGLDSLQTAALRGRDALLTPWERWWSGTAPWSRGLHWLHQAMIALIQGPDAHAADTIATPQLQHAQPHRRVARYKGVTQVIQNDPQGNFLLNQKESGSTIVVDAGSYRFNGEILEPTKRGNSSVYQQRGSEPVPLNRGIVFVYHEPLGILASYPNDRYPYGSKRNPGSVIAQLVRGDGSALAASSIDYVLLKYLYQPEGNAPLPTTTTGGSTKPKS